MTRVRDLSLRSATAADAVALSELAMRSKAYWGYPAEFMAACRAELTLSPQQLGEGKLIAELLHHNGNLVGFFALEALGATGFELVALFVEPAWIGRGAGRRLMQRALQKARAGGGKTLTIQGDPHADRFYLAAGCERAGERESGSIPGRMLPLFVARL